MDYYIDEDDDEIIEGMKESGWNYPLAFQEKRHCEEIKGSEAETQAWRMKERVMICPKSIIYNIDYIYDT